jgi:hypothetical protein
MALLTGLHRLRLARVLALLLAVTLVLPAPGAGAVSAPPTEHQVKAVFVFNFASFVEWPPGTFSSPTQPLVIGVLGNDELAAQLEEVVRGEQAAGHPMQLRRYRSAQEAGQNAGDCQILFIDRSQEAQLADLRAALATRPVLTVSDLDGAARRGVMIQFATDARRIRLVINVEAARAAGLTISSKLLRPAEIVQAAR